MGRALAGSTHDEIPARLSVVTLGARGMGVLRSFYRALGWPELPSGDETWTGFLVDGVLLALFPLRDLTAEAAPGSGNPTGWWGRHPRLHGRHPRRGRRGRRRGRLRWRDPGGRRDRPVVGGRSCVHRRSGGQPPGDYLGPRATFDARGALLSWD